MNINKKLSEYISSRGIKQTYISQKTGISQDAVSRILNGTRRISADEFLSICAALEIDTNIFRNLGAVPGANSDK